MTRITLSILLIILFQNAMAQNKDIEALKQLNEEWLNCSLKKDTARITKIFADDFVLISPKGGKMTKGDVVRNILYQDLESVTIDSIDVRILTNDAGIVTCYTTFLSKIDGKDVTGKNCYQDVYIKRKDKWFAISAHVTLLSLK